MEINQENNVEEAKMENLTQDANQDSESQEENSKWFIKKQTVKNKVNQLILLKNLLQPIN